MSMRISRNRSAAVSAAAALAVSIPMFAAGLTPAAAAATVPGISPLWTSTIGGATASGAIGGQAAVVVASTNGSLTSLDPATGALAARTQVGSVALNSRAAADGTSFYVEGANCTVTAISRATGARLWSQQISNSCSLLRGGLTVANGVVLAPTTTGGLHALDAATGTELWAVHAATGQTVGAPVVAVGIVYTGWDNGTLTAVSLATGAPVFSTTLTAPVRSTPTVSGGRVYVGDDSGTVSALDATTGRLVWQRTLAAAATGPVVRSTPVVAGGFVLVTVAQQVGATGSIVALDPATGAPAWRTTIGYSEAGVAVANGIAYATTADGALHAVAVATGTVLSTATGAVAAGPAGAPLVSGSRLFVVGQSGSLEAFSLTTSAAIATPTPTATATPTPTATPAPTSTPTATPTATPTPTPTATPTPTPTTTATSPSGETMPVGNLPGFTQAFSDNFSGTSVNSSKWGLYNGIPKAYPRTTWRPKNAIVSNGALNLAAYYDPTVGKWTSAGMSNARGLSQTYGMWEVRMRSDRSAGIDIAALLWPTKGWPPEIDFAEEDNGLRTTVTGTLHYGPSNKMIHSKASVDMTQWHTYGVIWTPGKIVYTVDGTPWATVVSANVPSQPMTLDLQTQTDGCYKVGACAVQAGHSMINTDIDWVVAYKYTPTAG